MAVHKDYNEGESHLGKAMEWNGYSRFSLNLRFQYLPYAYY